MPIKTAKVTGRRELQFHNIEDIQAEVERLASAEIRTLGNWSPGQIYWHLAKVMNDSIDGSAMRLSWFMRMLGRLFKGRMLNRPMPAGVKLPKAAAEVVEPPPTTLEQGLELYRTALRRQLTETNREPSPFLGQMTREEWTQLHCRHAELHLGFLIPDSDGRSTN